MTMFIARKCYASFPAMLTWLLLVLLSSQFQPCPCYTSFVFGDSLVDAGNNNYLFTLAKADSPPYGVDFKPSGGRPTGRFTNGRTIPDIIGQQLGAKSFPDPYLASSVNQLENTVRIGINYASGASGILDQTGILFIGRVSMREQVNDFEHSKSYMVEMMGENGTMEFLKKAIFIVTTGSNDILNYVQSSPPLVMGTDDVSPLTLQDMMISNLTLHLKRLHELGARKLVVVGVGPLGCIPFVRAVKLIPPGQCSTEVNAIVQGYNGKLIRALRGLNRDMGPDRSIFVYANSYDIFLNIISNHRSYGFEEASEPCCGALPPFLCFGDPTRNSSTGSVFCDDRSKYVFWDAYHPTEAANLIMARALLDGNQSMTSPINIRQLYH
ncbi:unnamed protein product [Linum tenue]|uniref:GDSL esterase/lipase At5g41890 n=1 Tax=Linum tenue TaxID=586396 RepID=A0AAV0JG41_9ROSI|nr:unnamed protein product [Linum tenue]